MTIQLLKTENEIIKILPYIVDLQTQHLKSLPGLFRDYINAEHLLEVFKSDIPNFIENIKNQKQMFFSFIENDTIVGCAICKDQKIGDYDFEDSHHLFLLAFTLDPKYRGQGIGKKAFNLLQEWAKQNHYHKLVLSVDTNNDTAISFYKNFGFRTEMMYMSKSL